MCGTCNSTIDSHQSIMCGGWLNPSVLNSTFIMPLTTCLPACLGQAWVVYLTAVRGSRELDAPAFVDLTMRVLDALGAACAGAGSYQEKALVPGEGELGMGTGSGERPHAQVRMPIPPTSIMEITYL